MVFIAAPILVKCKSNKDKNFKSVSLDIKKLIDENVNLGPTLVRLAWHSSGTYSIHSKSHGSDGGTIRHKQELSHGANAGLEGVIIKLSNIHKK